MAGSCEGCGNTGGCTCYVEIKPSSQDLYITYLEQQKAAMQAEIDSLMLEFCPDEMTPEQVENWKKHQVVAESLQKVKS